MKRGKARHRVRQSQGGGRGGGQSRVNIVSSDKRQEQSKQENRNLEHTARVTSKIKRLARDVEEVARSKVRYCVRQGKVKKSKARQGMSAERNYRSLDYEKQGKAMPSTAREGKG